MANRYWVGGTGTWDASDTTHWSATSGGASGASVPGSGDTVTFDGSSGGGTVTVGYDPTVTSITMGAFTGTLDMNTRSPTMQTFSNTGTGTRTLIQGSGTWTITGNATTVFNQTDVTNLTFTKGTNPFLFTYSGSVGTRTIVSSSLAAAGALSAHPDFSINAGSDIVAITNTRCGHLVFTGFSGSLASGTRVIYGNLTVSAAMTWASGTATTTFSGTSGTQTITTNGVACNSPFTVDGVGGTVLLAGNFSMDGASARTLTLTNGTFNASNFNVTCGLFSSSNSNVRTVTMGSGTWTLTGTGTVWNFSTTTNLTYNVGTSTVIVTDTSASSKTLNFAGPTAFNTLTIPSGGSGAIIFTATANRPITTLNITGPKTITFNTSGSYIVTNLNITGSAGNLVTMASNTPGTRFTLSVATGLVQARYASIQDSLATGGATFVALNSTNAGNNVGWNFTAGRTAASGRTSASGRVAVANRSTVSRRYSLI